MDLNGSLWVGTYDKGITVYDGSSWESTTGVASGFDYVSRITISGNNAWVSSKFGGVFFKSGSNWTVYNKTTTSNGIASNETYGTAIDSKGNLWVATYSGLAKDSLSKSIWKVFNTTNSTTMPTENLYDVCIDGFNNKWIATWGQGLLKLKDTTWTSFTTLNSGIPSDTINRIIKDNSGNLWIATTNGLAKFDGNTWTVFNKTTNPGKILYNRINDVDVDTDGNIYIATERGLTMYYNGAWYSMWSLNSNIPSNAITAVTFDESSDKLWIGTRSSGVASLAVLEIAVKSRTVSNFSIVPNPSNGPVFVLSQNLSFSNIQFIITDSNGKIFLTDRIREDRMQLETDLPAGIYLIKFYNDFLEENHKLVIY